ncbi:MAG: hypothetical protein ACFBSE_17955 [Prochloraceae cyanobacterium]
MVVVTFLQEELKVKVQKNGQILYEVDVKECDDYSKSIETNLKFVRFQLDREWRSAKVVCDFFQVLNRAVSQVHGESMRSLCHSPIKATTCEYKRIDRNQKVVCQLKKHYFKTKPDCN